jgi:hypothetical protein
MTAVRPPARQSAKPGKHFPDTDTLPWYRQFWPWFLIALPASVVCAAFVTLYIANRHSDDLVVDEYYKNGLAINRQLAKKQRSLELGITARVRVDGLSAVVSTTGPVEATSLSLRFSHPLEADRDFTVAVEDFGSGIYRGNLAGPVATRWHWILENPGADSWRLDGTLESADLGNDPR